MAFEKVVFDLGRVAGPGAEGIPKANFDCVNPWLLDDLRGKAGLRNVLGPGAAAIAGRVLVDRDQGWLAALAAAGASSVAPASRSTRLRSMFIGWSSSGRGAPQRSPG